MDVAVAALTAWQPETEPTPQGWFRDPLNCLRRPNGDPEKEYFAP